MFKEWMKKFVASLTKEKGKMAVNECGNVDFDIFWALYKVHIKNLGPIFFHTYLLICLNRDTSALLEF